MRNFSKRKANCGELTTLEFFKIIELMTKYRIDPNISSAETLPSRFYRSQEVYDQLIEKVFARSWQWIGDSSSLVEERNLVPFSFLEFGLEEPMLLSRNGEQIHCLSNVCTHRGNILCHHPKKGKSITCAYHGRRFDLDGEFLHMPEFKDVVDFPRQEDHLYRFPLKKWGNWLFTSLENHFDFDKVLEVMNRKVGFLPIEQMREKKSMNKDYLVNAHWALYCDNYLEGFHIPFVHQGLNEILEYGKYKTELFSHGNVQIGISKGAEHTFDLPESHEDFGEKISAYYFWIFPNMMFNFYPWGCSINVVKPIAINRTKVSFISYVMDESKLDTGSGVALDKVEREDEFVVEGVYKGMSSRVYKAGRFSPKMEKGVHQFHRLLDEFLSK